MKTLDKQKKNVLTLCGAAMASLLLWGCGGTNPTAESFERSDYYTRGIGQYPGDPKEDFSPSLAPDPSTYRNIARLRSAFASSSYHYNLVAQLATDGIVTDETAAVSELVYARWRRSETRTRMDDRRRAVFTEYFSRRRYLFPVYAGKL